MFIVRVRVARVAPLSGPASFLSAVASTNRESKYRDIFAFNAFVNSRLIAEYRTLRKIPSLFESFAFEVPTLRSA